MAQSKGIWGSSSCPHTCLWLLSLQLPPSHIASSIKLSHCHLCTVAVPWAPPSRRLWDSAFMCMSWSKSSPQASCTNLMRLFGETGFICLPTTEASQGGAEGLLSCSRAHSCFVTVWVALQREVCASRQGIVLEASSEVHQNLLWWK